MRRTSDIITNLVAAGNATFNEKILALDHILEAKPYFYDEMWEGLRAEWTTWVTTGSQAAQNTAGGWYRLTTGGTTNDEESIYWNDICPFDSTRLPIFEIVVDLEQLTAFTFDAGLTEISTGGDDDYVRVYFDPGADGNWHLETSSGGSTTVSNGSAATTNETTLRFDMIPGTGIKWYIDGTLQDTVVGNMPSAQLQPYVLVETAENAAHYVDIGAVKVWQDR
jgi:hypothetical protein